MRTLARPSASAERGPSQRSLVQEYVDLTRRAGSLEYALKHKSLTERETVAASGELHTTKERILEIEEIARIEGFSSALRDAPKVLPDYGAVRGGPSPTVRSAATAHLRAPASRNPFSSSTPRDPGYYRAQDAPVRAKTYEDSSASFRRLSAPPEYSPGINLVATEMANLDGDNFRDTHHGPGFRRAVTKSWIVGLAIGIEAAASVFARRILNGDVPIDIFPRQKTPEELVDGIEWEDIL